MTTNLIIDGNSILHRNFHANAAGSDPDDIVLSMCMLSVFHTFKNYYYKIRPDRVVITFDSYSWRKEYTKDLSKCVTNKHYKGHRRTNPDPRMQKLFKMLEGYIEEFYTLLSINSAMIILRGDFLEGDDLISAFVQMHQTENNVVLSGDGDMMQLMRFDNTRVFTPLGDKEQSLDKWEGNADLFLFEKCIRGEAKTNDNIQSSYPRLYKTKIAKAFHDEYSRENIMQHTFDQLDEVEDGEYISRTYKTRDLFNENMLLMDLLGQPPRIQAHMVRVVETAMAKKKRYNHMKFMRYCHNNNLLSILDKIEEFVPLMMCGG